MKSLTSVCTRVLFASLLLPACGSSSSSPPADGAGGDGSRHDGAVSDGSPGDAPASDGSPGDGAPMTGDGSPSSGDGPTSGDGRPAGDGGMDAGVTPGAGTATLGGSKGGKVTSQDGRVTLIVPSGAVPGLINFSITKVAMPPMGILGSAYDIGPSGTTFATPATVIFTPASADLMGSALTTVNIATVGPGGSWNAIANPVINTAAGTITVPTDHLSRFALIGGLCGTCTAECDPAMPTCMFMQEGMAPAAGRCVAYGKGCTRCVPTCDADGDGFCPPNAPGAYPGGDCDDTNPNVSPNAPEICGNGVDDNCNGHQDEGCRTCATDTDCPTFEACTNGVCTVCDANCDPAACRFGQIEGMPNSGEAGRCAPFGHSCSKCVPGCDTDGDGYCMGATTDAHPGGDCNDNNAAQSPGLPEVCGNGIDDNCNGAIDEGCTTCTKDADCPAQQACVSGLCQTCTGTCDATTCAAPSHCVSRGNGCAACVPACDVDGDGFCPGNPPGGEPGGDCDDSNAAINPNATEVCGNMKDDNCNGHIDEGCRTCSKGTDCAGLELCVGGVCQVCETCDPNACVFGAIDNMPGTGVAGRCADLGQGCSRCVPTCDKDGDGFCPGNPGMGQPGGDCDDTNPNIYPGAPEVCGNSADDDCDGTVDNGCSTCQKAATMCMAMQSCTSGM